MQSIFRLPWASDQFGLGAADKVRFATDFTTRSDPSVAKHIKRKRARTPDPDVAPRSEAKKIRPATATSSGSITTPPLNAVHLADQQQSPARIITQTIPAPVATVALAPATTQLKAVMADVHMYDAHPENDAAAQRRARLCQSIENQINLQTLLKHKELRLIEQELAKCQVALEQLRRCEIQPFLGMDGFDFAVSHGTGVALQSALGFTTPVYAPPAGVVDGPYTRHYRQWLIPDPAFDSQPLHLAVQALPQSTTARGGRVGRKTIATAVSPQQHGFPGAPQTVAPPPRRESNMPLVLRRSTDGKLVKLVCNNCNRGNMSSIQGFLNHCRIAHKVVYESHDAAAKDCGRTLDDQEIAELPAETQNQPVSKPVVRHAPIRPPTLAVAPSASVNVHILNAPDTKIVAPKTAKPARPVAVPQTTQAVQHANTPFKPATGLPRLSALFTKKHAGGDLEQAAIDARMRSEFASDELISPASQTPGSPAVVTPTSSRGSLSSTGSMHRLHGGKGRSQHAYSGLIQSSTGRGIESPKDNLSPHAVDSNPGLVSDLEDDSASDEESTAPHHTIQHPLGMSRTCGDSMDLAVAEDDGILHHGSVIIRRNSTFSAHERGCSTTKLGGNQAV